MSERASIKPIETEYRGYRFRSRLEARWAVFFDTIGAKWEYEPEGFELADGTKYLPDFLLHDVRGRGVQFSGGDIYVEIKGVLTPDDLHKIRLFAGYGQGEFGEPAGKPIIIFGQIPEMKWVTGRHFNGTPYAFWSFSCPEESLRFDGTLYDEFYNLEYSEGDNYWTEPKAGKGGGLVLDYPDNPYDFVDDAKTAEAYRAARQARFEHGECGAVKKTEKIWTPMGQIMSIISKADKETLVKLLPSVQRLQVRINSRENSAFGRIDALDWLLDHGYEPEGRLEHEQEIRQFMENGTPC